LPGQLDGSDNGFSASNTGYRQEAGVAGSMAEETQITDSRKRVGFGILSDDRVDGRITVK
jgi:hypothetical protein